MKTGTVSTTIEGIPPSLNHSYVISTRGGVVRRFKNKKLTEWIRLVCLTVGKLKVRDSDWYGIDIVYHLPIRFKNGNPRKKDLDNLIKYTIDPFLKSVNNGEIDDCRIIKINAAKVDGAEKTEIILYPIK